MRLSQTKHTCTFCGKETDLGTKFKDIIICRECGMNVLPKLIGECIAEQFAITHIPDTGGAATEQEELINEISEQIRESVINSL